MYIEAFTAGKDPRRPGANEDRVVIIPERAYAVIDGVTDKSGRLYGGLTGGRMAGEVIERAIWEFVAQEPFMTMPAAALVQCINAQFVEAYRRHGIEAQVADDPNVRFAAQLALVLCGEGSFRFVLIGDCGLRLDGAAVHVTHHPGDRITATMRAIVYHSLADSDEEQRLRTARAYALEGLGAFLPHHAARVPERDWLGLRASMLNVLPDRHEELPRSAVEAIIDTGIRGLARYRNAATALAFASIDGTDVPDELLRDFTLSTGAVHTIELFSDGYFIIPEGTTVRHWEDGFHRLEQEDPGKVKSVLSTKGSGGGSFTDDRTVLIIRRDHAPHA